MINSYIGVYSNSSRHINIKPYRVAVKRYIDGKPSWTNHGYFTCPHTAAFVFNIYAIHTLGRGAVLNNIHEDSIDDEELVDFAEQNDGFLTLMQKAAEYVEFHKGKFKLHDQITH